ncbi:M15 family metallopeptidase [Tenacibaculum finnmarkense]|uniref:M15 family metallopeptidase n=1 Tax=Tenacibaculum finnmarkense TaxID=2781243 RepID=UPI001E46B085|nr:M15 family metallopeptidase [Tenacibaculum finnmarkense]MCD8399841.1 M15 family metallopeptidase [Tenacibaculum finnmarkense genomovar ulcerans]MCD8431318.1 M15 family metallopeptidase [Tenacibaculum finnmarkense genomovar ulcerans]MCG8732630.1 M15 family metallopeptidase [Tenacibaculum finnmarkense]MCG8784404.1 M15 family metallopeptidase [Tenacibaculum finnmarkense]MCG8811904.1 M15 family metallopeptidase [Tenacibaculum finnmarkense]
MKQLFYLLLFCSFILNAQEKYLQEEPLKQQQNLPKGFSYIHDIAPTIKQEMRYCSKNNFVGTSINGYQEAVLIGSTAMAKALKKVQENLLKKGLSLKIFDAYRPQTAVNHFVKWARVINDTLMKQKYYPTINKRHLFRKGFIASKSGHSRGSTVDLTIVDLKTGNELDMGSPFDFFGISSNVSYPKLTKKQLENRKLLQAVMKAHNFRAYHKEWWHFTLRFEPFPKTYFKFPVQ